MSSVSLSHQSSSPTDSCLFCPPHFLSEAYHRTCPTWSFVMHLHVLEEDIHRHQLHLLNCIFIFESIYLCPLYSGYSTFVSCIYTITLRQLLHSPQVLTPVPLALCDPPSIVLKLTLATTSRYLISLTKRSSPHQNCH